MMLLLWVVVLGTASCRQKSYVYSYSGTVALPVVLAAGGDTSSILLLGTDSFRYNYDSFVLAKSGAESKMENIQSAIIGTVSITINNPDAANNLANMEYCIVDYSSSYSSDHSTLDTLYPADVYASFAEIPARYDAPLKQCFYNMHTSRYDGAPTITVTVWAKLRRPFTKPMDCTLQGVINATFFKGHKAYFSL